MGRWERPIPTLLMMIVVLASTTEGEAAHLHHARRHGRDAPDSWKGSSSPFGPPNLQELPFLPMTSSMGLFEVVVGQRSRHYEPPIDKDVSGSADVITGRNAAILQSPQGSQVTSSAEQVHQLVAAASTIAEVPNRTASPPQQVRQTPRLYPITQPVIFTSPIQTVAAPQVAQAAASSPAVQVAVAPAAPQSPPVIQHTVSSVIQFASPPAAPQAAPLVAHPAAPKLAPPVAPPPSLQLPLIPHRPPQLVVQHPPAEDDDDDEEEEDEDEDDDDEEKPTANQVAAKEAVEDDDDEDDEDEVKAEPEERFDLSFRKSPKFYLPPGSFMLPAVGKNQEEYYSKTEQALYIPLRATEQPFPVQTQVVLVQPKADTTSAEDLYHHKEDEGRPRPLVRPYHSDPADGSAHPPRPKSAAAPLDLVMTVYPNLPALLPQSQSNHGVKSVHEPKATAAGGAPPSGGSISVIHEVKVITPPQGYLPASVQPQQKQQQEAAAVIVGGGKPSAAGNDLITELKAPTGTSDSHASASTNNVASTHLAAHSPLFQVDAPSADQTGHAVRYVSFTPDDVSPSNAVQHGPSSDRNDVLRSPEESFSSNQVLPQGQVQDVNNPGSIQVIPMSFADGRLTLPFDQGARQPHHIDHLHFSKTPATGTPQSPQRFHVPGQTAEVVIGSKFQFPNDQPPQQPLQLSPSNQQFIVTGNFNNREFTKDGGIPVFGVPSFLPNQLQSSQDKSDRPFQPPDEELVTGRPNADQLIPFHAQQDKQVPGIVIHQDERPDASQYVKPALPQLQGNFKPMLDHGQPLYTPPVHDPLDYFQEADKVSDQDKPSAREEDESEEEEDDEEDEGDEEAASVDNEQVNQAGETSVSTTPASGEDGIPVSHLQASHADGQVAESKIHEGASHEEKSPQVMAIKPDARGPKHHHHHRKPVLYKPGKSSPKGAMYTVTQGHSKVKFFGYNALHKAMKHPDGTYVLYTEDPDWKISPYLPITSTSMDTIAGGTLVKRIPKKSISISAKHRPLRPVYFSKRQPTLSAENVKSKTFSLSDPFEYEAHLNKMQSDRIAPPTPSSTPATSTVATDNHDDSKGGEHKNE